MAYKCFVPRQYGLEHIRDSVMNLKQRQRWPAAPFANIFNYGMQATSKLNPYFFRCCRISPRWSIHITFGPNIRQRIILILSLV